MALNALLEIELAVPDPEALVGFWERRGLLHDGVGGLGTSERPRQLRVVEGSYRHLAEMRLGCDDGTDLVEIRERLRRLGVDAKVTDDTLWCVDPVLGHSVRIDVGAAPEPAAAAPRAINSPGSRSRRDRRSEVLEDVDPPAPRRLGHVVFGTPDVSAARAFFVDGLGYKVSDQVDGGMAVFARCSPDHHNLLLMPARTTYLNHYAVEMDDFDAVARAAHATLRERPDCGVVGPGRHVVGSNVFWYLLDPSGTMFEFFADMDQIIDDRKWDAEHRNDNWDNAFAVWGPTPPKMFFVPSDLPEIAAARASSGL